MATKFQNHILGPDLTANIPAAGSTPVGALYASSDENIVYRNNGSTWDTWATLGGSGGVTFEAKSDGGAASGVSLTAAGTGSLEFAGTGDMPDWFDYTDPTNLIATSAGWYTLQAQIAPYTAGLTAGKLFRLQVNMATKSFPIASPVAVTGYTYVEVTTNFKAYIDIGDTLSIYCTNRDSVTRDFYIYGVDIFRETYS